MKLMLATCLFLTLPLIATAGELDQEPTNKQMSNTVIVRIDTRTSEVAVLESEKSLNSKTEAQALINEKFQTVSQEKLRSELDRDAGSSSWYVYWYSYSWAYTPAYCWRGNYYYPYYTYNYSYYHYYYYGSPYTRWW